MEPKFGARWSPMPSELRQRLASLPSPRPPLPILPRPRYPPLRNAKWKPVHSRSHPVKSCKHGHHGGRTAASPHLAHAQPRRRWVAMHPLQSHHACLLLKRCKQKPPSCRSNLAYVCVLTDVCELLAAIVACHPHHDAQPDRVGQMCPWNFVQPTARSGNSIFSLPGQTLVAELERITGCQWGG
ncbi:hypothetical protein AUP68_09046 [Ilyonectria robusta]